MYPESLLYWIGGTAVLFGILGIMFLIMVAVENWSKNHPPKDKEDKDG